MCSLSGEDDMRGGNGIGAEPSEGSGAEKDLGVGAVFHGKKKSHCWLNGKLCRN